MAGVGTSGAGATHAGYGTTASTERNGLALQTSTGSLGSGRLIDPLTGDYVLDANGNFVGCTTAQQLVYLAIATVRGSSCVPGLGTNIQKIKFISETTASEVKAEIVGALSNIINNGLIKLTNVSVVTENNRMKVQIAWVDNETNIQYVNVI